MVEMFPIHRYCEALWVKDPPILCLGDIYKGEKVDFYLTVKQETYTHRLIHPDTNKLVERTVTYAEVHTTLKVPRGTRFIVSSKTGGKDRNRECWIVISDKQFLSNSSKKFFYDIARIG